jgi:hypothetical protein
LRLPALCVELDPVVALNPTIASTASSLKLETVSPCAQPDWDSQVAAHPDSTVFHSSAWAEVLGSTYGHDPQYLAAWDGPALAGLLPLMEVNSPITGRRGVSLPFTDSCPPLCSDRLSADQLWTAAIATGKLRGWKSIELRWDQTPLADAPPSLQFWGHSLQLHSNPELLFGRLHPSVRRAVRKARKEGVEVQIATSAEALDAFCLLHSQTRRRHGLPPQPSRFFHHLHRCLLGRGMGFVALAQHRGNPVAAAVFLQFAHRAVFKYGASRAGVSPLRANDLVMWEAILWLATHGCRHLDLGRTSLWNDGLRRFKLGWGTCERRISYYKYDLRHNAFVQDHDRARGWHAAVFARLPIPVLRWLGRILYPHLD